MKNKWKKERIRSDKDRGRIRQQWPHYTTAEKINYVISYYGIAIAAIIAAVAITVFLIQDIRSKKAEEAVFIMAADVEIPTESIASMQEELSNILSLDADTRKCVIEASYAGSANRQSEATISAYMQSGRVDLLIAPEEVFNRYAATGYLMDLKEAGELGLFDSMGAAKAGELGLFDGMDAEKAGTVECFYATQADYSQGGAVTELPFHPHEQTGDCGWYGIYLNQGICKGYVAGIMANCPHREYIKDSLRYLLDL